MCDSSHSAPPAPHLQCLLTSMRLVNPRLCPHTQVSMCLSAQLCWCRATEQWRRASLWAYQHRLKVCVCCVLLWGCFWSLFLLLWWHNVLMCCRRVHVRSMWQPAYSCTCVLPLTVPPGCVICCCCCRHTCCLSCCHQTSSSCKLPVGSQHHGSLGSTDHHTTHNKVHTHSWSYISSSNNNSTR